MREGAEWLSLCGVPTPRLDAELLLAIVLGTGRGRLVTMGRESLGVEQRERYGSLLRERGERRVPVQYLTGAQEFFSLEFRVDSRVLVPRPETELLVEELLAFRRAEIAAGRSVALVADVGTGSACIAVALAVTCPDRRIGENQGLALDPGLKVVATDISSGALQVAAENVRRHGVADRVALVATDILAALSEGGGFDAIICNPPYVAEEELEGLQIEVRGHEPRVALAGGHDGLEFYRKLVPQAAARLREGGLLAVELAALRAEPVREMLACGPWRDADFRKDHQGIPRVLSARRSGP